MRSIQSGTHKHERSRLWAPGSPLRGDPGMGVCDHASMIPRPGELERSVRTILAALAIAMATITPAYAQPRTIEIGAGEAEENLLDRSWPIVRTPWRQTDDLWEQVRAEGWTVIVLIDELGVVTEAIVTDGPAERQEEARALALGARYRPFVQDGELVRARFNFSVTAMPEDYHGPADRSFPAANQAEDIRIRLIRGGCASPYGTCPAYELEITGDGQVLYVGRRDVVREGEHSWSIPPERVAELVEVFRRAIYFKLRGHYAIASFHMSTQVTSIRIGEQEKFVFNYGATAELNTTVISPEQLAQVPWGEQMAPAAVVEVEDAIDRIAGVEPYVGTRDD